MASIDELEWETSKMFETVKIEDIFRYYPFHERSAHRKVMSKFEQEELFFLGTGRNKHDSVHNFWSRIWIIS